jgi:hypothetical protein
MNWLTRAPRAEQPSDQPPLVPNQIQHAKSLKKLQII